MNQERGPSLTFITSYNSLPTLSSPSLPCLSKNHLAQATRINIPNSCNQNVLSKNVTIFTFMRATSDHMHTNELLFHGVLNFTKD